MIIDHYTEYNYDGDLAPFPKLLKLGMETWQETALRARHYLAQQQRYMEFLVAENFKLMRENGLQKIQLNGHKTVTMHDHELLKQEVKALRRERDNLRKDISKLKKSSTK